MIEAPISIIHVTGTEGQVPSLVLPFMPIKELTFLLKLGFLRMNSRNFNLIDQCNFKINASRSLLLKVLNSTRNHH